MFSSSQGGALGGGGAHPCPSCTSLPWARARALPPGGATPRRCLFSSSSLATRSPVDNVQLVQVYSSAFNTWPSMFCIHWGKRERCQDWGGLKAPRWASQLLLGRPVATQSSQQGHGQFPPCVLKWA